MEVAKPKYYVWWDLDCLHVPRGGDPYEIRWIIESALNKKFGDGPVTIFAIGNLHRIPLPVLELISRAGIVIKHTPLGGTHINFDLMSWTYDHPTPAILMLISDREREYTNLEAVEAKGYTILRTYVNQKPRDSPKYASDVWLWKSLLTDTKQHENTPRPWQELQEKCCEADWYCILCRISSQSITDFTMHLKTKQHLRLEWFSVHPESPVEPTDEDLDSLHSQFMKHSVKQIKRRKCFIYDKRKGPIRLEPHWSEESRTSFSAILVEWFAAHPDASVEPTYEDLASLHSQLMNAMKQIRLRQIFMYHKPKPHADAYSSQLVPTEKDLGPKPLIHKLKDQVRKVCLLLNKTKRRKKIVCCFF